MCRKHCKTTNSASSRHLRKLFALFVPLFKGRDIKISRKGAEKTIIFKRFGVVPLCLHCILKTVFHANILQIFIFNKPCMDECAKESKMESKSID